MGLVNGHESDTLSDIDDNEVDRYLLNEDEKCFKKKIWENINREYLEEQSARVAATIAVKEGFAANFKGSSEELSVHELAATTKKKRKPKRLTEAKCLTSDQTAPGVTHRMLEKKRLSSKVNYEALEKLFAQTAEIPQNVKKQKTESLFKYDDMSPGEGREHITKKKNGRGEENELEKEDEEDQMGGETVAEEDEDDHWYYNDDEETCENTSLDNPISPGLTFPV
ncbi:hypothetical protein SAY86_011056 [Trapa natans]|uniref:Brf1 TBP-binding domain-containing protein n=1 Tax=Trapa natans TaxID=22666 RepID=A0AAN7LV97_TRANT|nr:hypothetical protein SAY86_011056 [Trapa natans]